MTSKNPITQSRITSLPEPRADKTVDISCYDIAYYRARAERLRAEAIAASIRKAKHGLASAVNRCLAAFQSWRRSPQPQNRLAQSARDRRKSEAQAIAELNAYSDKELAELGIARSTIAELVRHGRPRSFKQNRSRAA